MSRPVGAIVCHRTLSEYKGTGGNDVRNRGLTDLTHWRSCEMTRATTIRVQAAIIELLPALRNFAHRFYKQDSDVDDLVQDTVTKALGNLDKFQEGTRLKSWLFTIMRNTFATRYLVGKRTITGLDDMIGIEPSQQPSQEWVLRGHELQEAFKALPQCYRPAAQIILLEGASYEDAAVLMGCKVGTVKSRVNRARALLANKMGDSLSAAAFI